MNEPRQPRTSLSNPLQSWALGQTILIAPFYSCPQTHDAARLWQRVTANAMPPGSKKLTASEKDTLRQWIAEGAKTARAEPENPDDARFTEEDLHFWAWQPVHNP